MVEKWRTQPVRPHGAARISAAIVGVCAFAPKITNAISAPRRHPCKSAARDLFALHRNYSRQILILQGQILTRPGTIGSVVTQPTPTRPPLISRPNLLRSALTNPSLFVLQAVSDAVLAELKQCFLEAYDDNQDGKIDIREVSHCSKLPFQSILSSWGVIHGE
jgi:hypothetical protein